MPSPRTMPDPVARRDRPGVAVRVADGLGDLAGRDRLDAPSPIVAGVGRRPRPRGRRRSSAASASGIDRVGTTTTVFDVSASTCSATGMMFLLFGRITTCSALTCSTASSSSAVDGLSVWPPADDALHAAARGTARRARRRCSRRRPRVVTGGSPAPAGRDGDVAPDASAASRGVLALGLLVGDLLEQVGDPDLLRAAVEVERHLDRPRRCRWCGRGSSTSPSPPTTTIESPIAPQPCLNASMRLVGEVEEVHHLVALLADVELAVDARRAGGPRRRTGRARPAPIGARRRARAAASRRRRAARSRAAAGSRRRRRRPRRRPSAPAAARACCRAPPAGGAGGAAAPRRATPPSADAALAASADSRTTVRIVPSIGLSTAW